MREPLRIFAAFTVLAISMAMVRGPTPPGTGVIAPATSAALGCASPTSVDPFVRKLSSRLALPAKNRWKQATPAKQLEEIKKENVVAEKIKKENEGD